MLMKCRGHGGEVVTTVAWLYTAGSVIIPSMGSVYNEFALKRNMDTSLHLQNFFLYFYGMCFNLLFVTAMMLISGSSFLSMFSGYSLVCLQQPPEMKMECKTFFGHVLLSGSNVQVVS